MISRPTVASRLDGPGTAGRQAFPARQRDGHAREVHAAPSGSRAVAPQERQHAGRGFHQVGVGTTAIELLAGALTAQRVEQLQTVAGHARRLLADRIVWNISATEHGGGVAEMLHSLLAYGRGAGVDTRWLVIDADAEFFAITKRLHNALHGDAGDGGPLGEAEHAHYRNVLAANHARIGGLVRPHDIVVLHDPQTAALVQGLHASGARVVWRCHIGCDLHNQHTRDGWTFLRRYARHADAFVFSRAEYVPSWVRPNQLWIIAPSIDPSAAKNQALQGEEVCAILRRVGLLAGDGAAGTSLPIIHPDGSQGLIRRHRDLLYHGTPPAAADRLIVQVSRWDRLKDMAGVMAGFAAQPTPDDIHLVLAGPEVSGVSDDPEGAAVFLECAEQWWNLPAAIRGRVHLARIPMDDADENALIVNALQRRAYVVVQKSLVEGFGLTVTEALWKARPVIASAVGGIRDQITNGHDGVLLGDPRSLDEFGSALRRIIDDPAAAARLGAAGHLRVRDHYLADRDLTRYVHLFAHLIV